MAPLGTVYGGTRGELVQRDLESYTEGQGMIRRQEWGG